MDLVIQGHNHVFKRTDPIRYGRKSAEAPDGSAINSAGDPSGTKEAEVADWSQVRYDDYAVIAVDVRPAHRDRPTTFTIRTLADALPGSPSPLREIDRVTFRHLAGRARITTLRHRS